MKVCFINYPAEHYTTTRPRAIAIVIQGLTLRTGEAWP